MSSRDRAGKIFAPQFIVFRSSLPAVFLIVSLLTMPVRAADDAETEKALALVNAARRACDLEPVKLSASLSDACRKHARYLVINRGNSLIEGLKAHEENETLPGSSKE